MSTHFIFCQTFIFYSRNVFRPTIFILPHQTQQQNRELPQKFELNVKERRGRVDMERESRTLCKETVTRIRKLRKETFSPVGHPKASFHSFLANCQQYPMYQRILDRKTTEFIECITFEK